MGNRKNIYKMIAGVLIFFMVVAGAVPTISACEGNCCSVEPIVLQDTCHEPILSVNHTMPDMDMSHIKIADNLFPVRDNPSGLPDCHEKNSHSCCEVELPLATTKVYDFGINTSQTDYYQSEAILISVSGFSSTSDQFHLKGTLYLTAARAAPIQLFLLNLSILC
jgi:hypothetical protein